MSTNTVFAFVTIISLVNMISKPTELAINFIKPGLIPVNMKFPFRSEIVPIFVPCIAMFEKGIGSLFF